MSNNANALGNALQILIERGSLSRDEFPIIHENIINDGGVLNDLEILCQNMGLYLNEKAGTFYVSPIPGVKTFGFSNEEMRREFGYYFNNEDLYTALFITANIITEFFPEAGTVPSRQFLKSNELMEIIDRKIDVLREQTNLEAISYEKSYNFEIVVKKWSQLPTVKLDKGESENRKEYGKTSKIQLLNTTLRFLENQELIKLVDFNGDKSIYITERFKATILNAYNADEVQSEIYNYIDNIVVD